MSDRKIRLLLDSGSERWVQRVSKLADDLFDLVTYVRQGAHRVNDLIRDVDAVYIYQDEISASAIRSAPTLRFIQKHGLNCKNIDLAAAAERAIPVATMPLFRNGAVAEHAMALMLACSHKILAGHRAVEAGVYRDKGLKPVLTEHRVYSPNWAEIPNVLELMGATVGIVGLGDIGIELAQRCRAFGMTVIYHQRSRHLKSVEDAYHVRYMPLPDMLREADYLVMIVPHTPQTDKMIGATELAMMKPTATLINVARGGVVDEPALIEALQRGVIAMAGLDVYREEPLPITSPLIGMPNVVLTPHLGGGSYRFHSVDHQSCLDNILRHFRGEQPLNLVAG